MSKNRGVRAKVLVFVPVIDYSYPLASSFERMFSIFSFNFGTLFFNDIPYNLYIYTKVCMDKNIS